MSMRERCVCDSLHQAEEKKLLRYRNYVFEAVCCSPALNGEVEVGGLSEAQPKAILNRGVETNAITGRCEQVRLLPCW